MRSEVTILSLPFLLLLPPNSYDCLLIIARISYTRRIFRFRKFRSLTFEFSRGTRGHLVASVASNDVRLRIGVVGINSNARRIRPAVRRDLFCRYSDARHQWSIPHRGCVGEIFPLPACWSRPRTLARTFCRDPLRGARNPYVSYVCISFRFRPILTSCIRLFVASSYSCAVAICFHHVLFSFLPSYSVAAVRGQAS